MFTKTIISIAFSLVLLHALPLSAKEISHWKSADQIDIYYIHVPELPMVDINIIFDAGSSRSDDLPGLAMLTGNLLDQGAGDADADAISQGFESVGAIYSASVNKDWALIGLRSLTEPTLLDRAIDNLATVISQPNFTESDVTREQNLMLSTIQQNKQSPSYLAQDALMQQLYLSHPYAISGFGREDTINLIDREDIERFYNQYYVRSNMKLVVVGAVDREKLEMIASRLVRDLPVGEKAMPIPSVEKNLVNSEPIFIAHPSAQTHILLGQTAIQRTADDFFSLYVGNHILGGSSMTSRLFTEVREKRGLAYSVYSYFMPLREIGPFISGLQTKHDNVDEALSILDEHIKQFIKDGPSIEELEHAKQNILRGFTHKIATNSQLISYASTIAYYDLPLDYLEYFSERIRTVSIEDVRLAFQRHLLTDHFIVVLVGQKDDLQAN